MNLHIVALYAGLNGLLALLLAVRVSSHRRASAVGLGIGSSPALEKAVRAHGNHIENAPLFLLLLLILALGGLLPIWLHLLGLVFTVGRILHAWGLSQSAGTSFGRFAGIVLTWSSLLVAIGINLVWGVMIL
jgi:uncharacterized membrane protein YecN with MAPEG domain